MHASAKRGRLQPIGLYQLASKLQAEATDHSFHHRSYYGLLHGEATIVSPKPVGTPPSLDDLRFRIATIQLIY